MESQLRATSNRGATWTPQCLRSWCQAVCNTHTNSPTVTWNSSPCKLTEKSKNTRQPKPYSRLQTKNPKRQGSVCVTPSLCIICFTTLSFWLPRKQVSKQMTLILINRYSQGAAMAHPISTNPRNCDDQARNPSPQDEQKPLLEVIYPMCHRKSKPQSKELSNINLHRRDPQDSQKRNRVVPWLRNWPPCEKSNITQLRQKKGNLTP